MIEIFRLLALKFKNINSHLQFLHFISNQMFYVIKLCQRRLFDRFLNKSLRRCLHLAKIKVGCIRIFSKVLSFVIHRRLDECSYTDMNTAKLKIKSETGQVGAPLKDLKEQTVLNMRKNTCEKFIKFTAPKTPETSKNQFLKMMSKNVTNMAQRTKK